MPEPNLAISWYDLVDWASYKFGFGRTYSAIGSDKQWLVGQALQSMLRWVIFPEQVGQRPYSWNFLRPTTTMLAWGPVEADAAATVTAGDDGVTITGSTYEADYDGETRITATGSVFNEHLVGKTLIADVTGTPASYTITRYTSATVIYVSGDASGESGQEWAISGQTMLKSDDTAEFEFQSSMPGQSIVINETGGDATYEILSVTSGTYAFVEGTSAASGDTFSITPDGNYELPANVGSIIGEMTFGDDTAWPAITRTGVGTIQEWRQVDRDSAGRPRYSAIQSKAQVDGAGQRLELLLWPVPDTDYTLHYRYHLLLNELSATNPYPPGGAAMAEVYKAAIEAVIEREKFNRKGEAWETFIGRLRAAIEYDTQNAPEFYGVDIGGRRRVFPRHMGVMGTHENE